jgi:predicted phage terminase large subunit-like protein
LKARREQLPSDDDSWNTWLILAGRGFGKTKSAAEWIAWQAIRNPNTRWAIVSPTFSDVRDTCAEGPSGIVNVLNEYKVIKNYNRSIGEITLINNSRIKLFSGSEPDRLRGPNFHGGWFDELAAFHNPDSWTQYQFALRLGKHPQTIVTTTPRPTKLIKELSTMEGVKVVRGSTFDNANNLAPSALAELRKRYDGTRIGRQELYGEILEDVEGALWTNTLIDDARVDQAPEMRRIVVAIDPSGGSTASNDEQGIVVAGEGVDGEFYVLADRSVRLSPAGWAQVAINAYREFEADRIVAEKNFGGEMVESTIRQIDYNVPVRMVTASKGKKQRAEPIAALYEQGRVHHVKTFPQLEEQMTTWTQLYGGSPDRMDALVWALTELTSGMSASAWSAYMRAQATPADTVEDDAELLLDRASIRQASFRQGLDSMGRNSNGRIR